MPVILSDEVELPFQNLIDYTEISIKWPSSRIGPELLGYLESIPGEKYHLSSFSFIFLFDCLETPSLQCIWYVKRSLYLRVQMKGLRK